MPYPWKSFRDWLAAEEARGEVMRIEDPIKAGDPDSIVDIMPPYLKEEYLRVSNIETVDAQQYETELRGLVAYLHRQDLSPIGVVEKPVNNMPEVPLVVNPWATRARVMRSFGCKDKEEVCRKFAALRTNLIPPEVVSADNAPVKEVIIREPDINTYRDIPRCWVEFEAMPWSVTGGGEFVVYDPDSKTHNLGEWKAGFLEWEEGDSSRPLPEDLRKNHMVACLAFKGSQASDGGQFYAKLQAQNKPMPGAYIMCGEPSLLGVASARESLVWPSDGVDEYAAAGGFRGAPVEVVPSETIPGLMVPAHAEYIIEGEFLPNEHYTVPPFGEGFFQGYVLPGNFTTLFRIKCITRRKDAMWSLTWSNNDSTHQGIHAAVINLCLEAETINAIRQFGYDIQDVVAYDMGLVVVQTKVDGMEKGVAHYGKALLNALYASPTRYIGNSNKYYIAVGPDIDPYDLRDIVWALNTRVQPVSDTIVIAQGGCPWGDPSGTPLALNRNRRTLGEQVLIDALIKVPERYESYPPRTDPRSWEDKAVADMRSRLNRNRAA